MQNVIKIFGVFFDWPLKNRSAVSEGQLLSVERYGWNVWKTNFITLNMMWLKMCCSKHYFCLIIKRKNNEVTEVQFPVLLSWTGGWKIPQGAHYWLRDCSSLLDQQLPLLWVSSHSCTQVITSLPGLKRRLQLVNTYSDQKNISVWR